LDELKLREEQVVTPVSVEELTRSLTPAQAASILGQAIRTGGQFFATADGDVVLEGGKGQPTRVIEGIRHEVRQEVKGVGAEPIYAVNVKA
jgi:hypothetical protein